MERVLVTGAAGFTGKHFGLRLANERFELHGLINEDGHVSLPGYAELHRGDLTAIESISEVVHTVRPDKIVHLAAIANVAHDDIGELYRVNVVGTRNLLDAVLRCGFNPTAILLASSANIYGNAGEGMLDESVTARPVNDYGVSKASMELVASIYAGELPIIISRPFNYTGRSQSLHFLVPKIVAHAKQRRRSIQLGNLDVSRDFSDVRTVVDAYSRLILTERALGKTVNVCSGRSISLREIIAAVERLSGHHMDVEISSALSRGNEVQRLWGSKALIESVIGPLADIQFDETLRWMLADTAD